MKDKQFKQFQETLKSLLEQLNRFESRKIHLLSKTGLDNDLLTQVAKIESLLKLSMTASKRMYLEEEKEDIQQQLFNETADFVSKVSEITLKEVVRAPHHKLMDSLTKIIKETA